MHHASHNVNTNVFKSERQDPDIDAHAVAEANRRFDAQTGFRLSYPGAGLNRLRYPPYVPAIPGFVKPDGHEESESMTTAIQAWNHTWFAEHFPTP